MEVIKSKYGFKVIFIISFTFLLLFGIGIFGIYNEILLFVNDSLAPRDLLTFIVSILAIVCAFSLIKVYKRNAPRIEVDKEKIRYGKEVYFWKDMRKIQLISNEHKKIWFLSASFSASALYFHDNKKILIYDNFSNAWEIKSFIQQIIIEKKEKMEYELPELKELILHENEQGIKFAGYQIFTSRAYFLWIVNTIAIVGLYTCITMNELEISLILILFIILHFLFHSHVMNYFILTEKFLIIKKHNLFWYKKIIPFEQIKKIEVTGIIDSRIPGSVALILNNYRTCKFSFCTLSDKTIIELRDKLKLTGIPVSSYYCY